MKENFRKKLIKGSAAAFVLLLTLLCVSACTHNDKPQPVDLGKDNCAKCGMTIEEPQFACEIITDKGKCFKFDDLSCLFHHIHDKKLSDSIVAKIYVADYEHPDTLIDIKTAHLVLGEDIKSPMNGGVVAFKNKNHARTFATKTRSILLDSWERLKIQHAVN